MNTQVNATLAPINREAKVSAVLAYIPSNATDTEGMRWSIARWWNTEKAKATNAVRPAKMILIPTIDLSLWFTDSDFKTKAQQVFQGVIEDQQDILIKQSIEKGESQITWDSISIASCLDALTAVRVSQRLNKEMIEGWVKAAMLETLKLRGIEIASTKGIDQATQVAKTTNDYTDLFGRLAAPVPKLDMDQCNALVAMLKRAALTDDMSKALGSKLFILLNPKAIDSGNL